LQQHHRLTLFAQTEAIEQAVAQSRKLDSVVKGHQMDILKESYEKISALNNDQIPVGIRAVFTHIENAEKHYAQAKSTRNVHLFTDVIYRTNHAFEGILKEAYTILNGDTVAKKSTYEIETFLSENAVLKERVMELFANYRKNWRNTSTHDYELFFTEQGAFLAIVTVSAFVNILLDQIIEKISAEAEQKKLEQRAREIRKDIANYAGLSSIDKVAAILVKFSTEIQSDLERIKRLPATQFLGMLTGFMMAIEPGISIEISPALDHAASAMKPDLLLILNMERVAIAIIYAGQDPDVENYFADNLEIPRMRSFLERSGISSGVLYYLPRTQNDVITRTLTTLAFKPEGINIREVTGEDSRSFGSAEDYEDTPDDN
jgi:hypothetical protein